MTFPLSLSSVYHNPHPHTLCTPPPPPPPPPLSLPLSPSRGLSSTVRRCVCKETGREYAVKIVDRKQEESITETITVEIQTLRALPHHKHISKYRECVEREFMLYCNPCTRGHCTYTQSVCQTALSHSYTNIVLSLKKAAACSSNNPFTFPSMVLALFNNTVLWLMEIFTVLLIARAYCIIFQSVHNVAKPYISGKATRTSVLYLVITLCISKLLSILAMLSVSFDLLPMLDRMLLASKMFTSIVKYNRTMQYLLSCVWCAPSITCITCVSA